MKQVPEIKRVMNGLYSFGKKGSISHQPWQNKEKPWRVKWYTWMSERVVREFRTLKEAREYVKSLY